MSAAREQLLIRASWVSIIGNALLSLAKIIIGLIAGSFAVLADGIDSATDIVTSVVTLIAAHVVSRPPSVRFPYGFERADTIASKALSFIIFFAGAQLAISTLQRLMEGIERELPSMLAIYVTLISIAGKVLLAFYQHHIGKKTGSSMLTANARNMVNDVIISLAVLLGLAFTFILKMPVFDTITGLAVSVWIMYVAYRIFMKSNLELMDGVEDASVYTKVFDAISRVKGVSNPHRARIRKIGYQYVVAVDVEIDGRISLLEAHDLAHHVEEEIRKELVHVYDVMVHPEPQGDDGSREKFGVSPGDLNDLPPKKRK
jgi:cation diffusion facilitator family transporter